MENPALELDEKNVGENVSNGFNHNTNSKIQDNFISENGGKIEEEEDNEILYGVEDVPPWYICIFLGLQHYLEMISCTIAVPFFLCPALCMLNDDPQKANIINTLVFMSGIITVLQSTVGTRLPIVQGGSFSYLLPSLAIMNLPQWKCPTESKIMGMSEADKLELWQVRMREIQGAIIFAALFETIFALTGVIGFMLRYLTPLAVCPAICLIGISLFKQAAIECSKNFPVAIATLLLLIIFSQHMRNIKIPFLCGKKDKNGVKEKFPLFQVFPVLMAVALVWMICGILTAADVFDKDDAARTDTKSKIFKDSPWFRVPYPFQWGWPTVSIGAVLGVLCGVLTSTIESLGDYYVCADFCKIPIPPISAMNRGIFVEGFGCVLSGILGSGNASTSYSNNIGTITVTKVASRRVVQVSGILTIFLGLIGKAGAVFVGLPDPIIGGLFCFIFPLVMAVGISTLSEIKLTSSRNIFIVSFAIFMGLAVSQWMNNNPGVIRTGSDDLDNLIIVLLSTGMFVAGFIGFVLDNTISGTLEERGLAHRKRAQEEAEKAGDKTYDLPYVMGFIRKFKIFKYLPISPTYEKHPMELLPFFKNKNKS